MKKGIFALCILYALTTVAFGATSCTDLPYTLSKYAESNSVRMLQNFLYAKGLLKVVPNGYFGPSTFASVKAYQGGRGISQTGTVGPLTRAMIKSESCVQTVPPSLPVVSQNPVQNQGVQIPVPQTNVPTITYPRPVITSSDLVTLFAKGKTDWGFSLYGSGFSTTSNAISFKNTGTGRTYAIGTVASATGTSLLLPTNLTGMTYSCGTGCSEQLPSGQYEIYVTNLGGQSDPKTISIQPFTLSVQNMAVNTLPASGTNLKMAVASYSSPVAVTVRVAAFDLGTSTISGGGVAVSLLKDELEGDSFTPDQVLSPFATGVIGVYATTNNTIPGTLWGRFSLTIEDFVGKKKTVFTSDDLMATVAGVL
jgi:peptidoglycan hydrolase-like protein with peptidoglycan-binding domain